MITEDRAEMQRRLSQEYLLHAHNFEPVRPGDRELWVRDDELHTRSRALVVALAELAAGEEARAR